jgi:hypothetical protein
MGETSRNCLAKQVADLRGHLAAPAVGNIGNAGEVVQIVSKNRFRRYDQFGECRVRADSSAPPKASPRGHLFRGLKKLNLVDRVDPDLKRAVLSGA